MSVAKEVKNVGGKNSVIWERERRVLTVLIQLGCLTLVNLFNQTPVKEPIRGPMNSMKLVIPLNFIS